MNTPETPGKKPEETKKETGETLPNTSPDAKKQADETSHRVTPADPDIIPKDSTREAKDRWESESPAVKGHPQQNIPEDVNAEKTENPDGDDEELLKKRDETGIA